MRGLAFLLLALVGCDARPAEAPRSTRLFTDSRGKKVAVPYPPQRIVSIVPSVTEILFAVGAGPQVAAVTTHCVYPPEARAKPKVGDIVVDIEGVAALRPDLIVTAWSLTRRTVEDLEAKGYTVFAVDPGNFEEIAASLRTLGEVTGRADEGARAAEALLARVKTAPPGPTIYFEHSSDPIGTTGPETYTGDALRRAGGRNIVEGGWKTIDWEVVLARDPEVILIAHEQREGLERRAGWKNLRAVKSGRVHFVAVDHYIFPTPRLVAGLEEAARLFHEKTP